MAAKVLDNVARTYTGAAGAALLAQQDYDPDMIEHLEAVPGDPASTAGIRTLKFRASMAWLSTLRFTGLYRLANTPALLDAWIRGVSPDAAGGARYGDS